MNKNLHLFFAVFFCLITEGLRAQQEGQHTMFMFNSLAINPGVAGSRNQIALAATYRNQWLGFKGAPVQQTLTVHAPLAQSRLGIGYAFTNRRIGIMDAQTSIFSMSYSLIYTPDFSFRIGMQGSVRRLGLRFADEEQVVAVGSDPSISNRTKRDYYGNFGAGVFATWRDCYVGASVPFYVSNVIGVNQTLPNAAVEQPHYYVMAGLSIPITKELIAQPSGMVRYTQNAPWSFEMNFTVNYQSKVMAGIGYRGGKTSLDRDGESISLLCYYHLSEAFGIGCAYDFNISQLHQYTSGSFEIVSRYDITTKKSKFSNPKIFF